MNVKSTVTAMLEAATGAKVYWLTTPSGFVPGATPWIIAQQVSGRREWYVDNDTSPGLRHARIQFVNFAKRRSDADAMAMLISETLRTSNLTVEPHGEPTDGYEDSIAQHTSLQQFSVYYPTA